MMSVLRVSDIPRPEVVSNYEACEGHRDQSSASPEKQEQDDHYEQDHERSWPNKPSSITAVSTDEHAAGGEQRKD